MFYYIFVVMTQRSHKKKAVGGNGNTVIVPLNSSSRHRNWFFTLNNYTRKDIDTIFDEMCKLYCKQYCFQEEKGKEGTPHLQGVIAYDNAISFNTMKTLLPRANWKVAKNLKLALAYCCKEDTRNGKTWTWNYVIPKVWTNDEIGEWWINEHIKNMDWAKDLTL